MARFVDFEDTNFSWGPPEGMEDRVGTLKVCRLEDQHGVAHNFSCWELTDQEVEMIIESKRVFLDVLAVRHPPVMVTAYGPEAFYPKQIMNMREEKKPIPMAEPGTGNAAGTKDASAAEEPETGNAAGPEAGNAKEPEAGNAAGKKIYG